MCCEQCVIDCLVSESGWDVEDFDYYCPGQLEAEVKRTYVRIMAECHREKLISQKKWHSKKITQQQHTDFCKRMVKFYNEKFIAHIINFSNDTFSYPDPTCSQFRSR